MRKPESIEEVRALERVAIPQGGCEVYHVEDTVRRLIAVILTGEQAPSLSASIVEYTLETGDRVTAACHIGEGHYPENQDRIVINIDGSRISGIDGFKYDGARAADILGEQFIFDDADRGAHDAHDTMKTEIAWNSGACFAQGHIVKTDAGKQWESVQAGDVHMVVLNEHGEKMWESKNENTVQVAVESGALTEDEALYEGNRGGILNYVKPNEQLALTHNDPCPLQPGYRVIIASDGLFDNLTTREVLQNIAGLAPRAAIEKVGEIVQRRMQNTALRQEAVDGRRKKKGEFSDGFLSKPKPDTISIAIIDIV